MEYDINIFSFLNSDFQNWPEKWLMGFFSIWVYNPQKWLLSVFLLIVIKIVQKKDLSPESSLPQIYFQWVFRKMGVRIF